MAIYLSNRLHGFTAFYNRSPICDNINVLINSLFSWQNSVANFVAGGNIRPLHRLRKPFYYWLSLEKQRPIVKSQPLKPRYSMLTIWSHITLGQYRLIHLGLPYDLSFTPTFRPLNACTNEPVEIKFHKYPIFRLGHHHVVHATFPSVDKLMTLF